MVEGWYERSNRTWGRVLEETAARFPDNALVLYRGEHLTYAAFRERVRAFARGLLALGVGRGDHTALWMTNCPEWLVAQFATYTIGSPLVPINTRLSRDEVAYVLQQSDASTLVLRDRVLGDKIDAAGWLEQLVPEIAQSEPGRLSCERLPRLRRVISLGERPLRGAYSFEEVLELGRRSVDDDLLDSVAAAVAPCDVANLMFTSGTTGFPKGAQSMHRNNLAAMLHWIERTDLRSSDRMYLGVPLATNFGCAYVSQVSVLAGNAIVMHETFAPEAALKAIARERVTWFPGAPTMYVMMLAHPDLARFDRSSLRAAIVGGAPCPPETVYAIRERLGADFVVQCYGLSECGGVSTANLSTDPIEKAATTVGVPFPSCRLRVVDPQTQRDVAVEETGEIWLHDALPGSCVGKGYYAMPERTAEAITPDRWFRTADLGSLDRDGYLRITGRLTDMFIVGGFNAYPAEIEAVLHAHPQVRMAQVVGVPDPRLGEVGVACVELAAGETANEAEILAFCRERLANYKVPRHVRFLSDADFPLTASGKVQKFLLRERLCRELGV